MKISEEEAKRHRQIDRYEIDIKQTDKYCKLKGRGTKKGEKMYKK